MAPTYTLLPVTSAVPGSPSVRQKCPALSSVCAVRCENVPPQNIKSHETSASVTDNEGIQYYIVKIVNVQFCCYLLC